MAYQKDESVIHNEFTSYDEIVEAVKNGEKIKWANGLYNVEYWNKQGWLMVTCSTNNHSVGLGETDYDISRCFRA